MTRSSSTTTSSTATTTQTIPDTSSSTAASTTTTTEPPPAPLPEHVPLPGPPRWHFEGRHAGIEHFVLYSGRCAFLDHHLQETFTLDDGSKWDFDAIYCGTLDANNLWTGVGSFTLTTGPGSTLTGTFTDSAKVPSTGVPYVLDVHAGTGDLVGAHGSCALENHLRPIEFGAQEQFGTFVCDLAG